MELLHMKIFDLLLEPDLDFLRFSKHEPGWGLRYPGQGIFTPHPVLFDMPCDMLLRSIK